MDQQGRWAVQGVKQGVSDTWEQQLGEGELRCLFGHSVEKTGNQEESIAWHAPFQTQINNMVYDGMKWNALSIST